MKRKVGIFGGTFDPVHLGHLIIGQYVLEELNLDEMWFMPASYHRFKNKESISSAEHRLAMLYLATESNPCFKVNEHEIHSTEITYTYNTLSHFKKTYPETDFYFLLGVDNLNQFHEWYMPEALLEMATIVTFGRPDVDLNSQGEAYRNRTLFLKTPLLEVSSTHIRELIRTGRNACYFLPDAVWKYIQEKGIY